MDKCKITEWKIKDSFRSLKIENEILYATILLDKGADIYELVYKPLQMDVLWKSPWGVKIPGRGAQSAFHSHASALENYPGGWQMIFPNGGPACTYKGVELNFHGEAAMTYWDYEIVAAEGEIAEVRLFTRLFRSPFRLERVIRVEAGKPWLSIREQIKNESGEEMDYMWGQHPAFGPPFLSSDCRIDTGATCLEADDTMDSPVNPLVTGQEYDWPISRVDEKTIDFSMVPQQSDERFLIAYFKNFKSGWYGITNTKLGFGVGMVWPEEVFPYAWFWQEINASSGFPFYKNSYVMAIEPFSSYPAQGLASVMEKTATHRMLAPGESVDVEYKILFYESATGVCDICSDGNVLIRN